MPQRFASGNRFLIWLVFSWGLSAFFPVGVAYTHMVLVAACLSGDLRQRLGALRQRELLWPMAAFLLWTLLATAYGPWVDDSPVRLFHIVRVLLLFVIGMLLTPAEAVMAMKGFLVGAVLAALIVAVHHVWGLPPWTIWASLLKSRNNFSSGNMIMMAIAAGSFFYLGLRNERRWIGRWVPWAAALALTVTVAEHAVSRNAQLLLPILMATALLLHYRGWHSILVSVALVAAMVLGAMQWSATTHGRFLAVAEEGRRIVTSSDYTTSVGARWRMGQEALNGMMEHPLFGVGLGSWLPRWRQVAQESAQSLPAEMRVRHTEINNPHNDYLLTGMETGVPGMLIMVWLLVAFLFVGWRQRSTAGGITVVLCVGVMVTATINAPLRDAALGMTLLWLLGASIAGHKAAADD